MVERRSRALARNIAAYWEPQQRMFSVHIPKTGGTTFQTVLGQEFGARLVLDYDLPREEVNRLIGGGDAFCIHGHFRLEKYADVGDATYVTWMRDPIDRLISWYNFWSNYRFPDHMLWRHVHYGQMDFLTFAKLKFIQDEQSRYFSGRSLDDFAFVGVTELFSEGMELFRDQFNISCDLANLPRLRDSGKFRKLFDRSQLSRKELAILYDAHGVDTQLYHQAVAHFRKNAQRFSASAVVEKGARSARKKDEAADYAKLMWGGQYLPAETEQSALSHRELISQRLQRAGITKIRGSYYYGDAWPVNVWDSFRPELADRLLHALRDNGYNTVILLIPAGLELLKRKRPADYAQFLKDLTFLLGRIRSMGLTYAYRIGYGWEGYPVDEHRGHHLFSLISPGPIQQNYLTILAELWQMVKDDPLFLMGFTTWEDLISNPINLATKEPPERKALMAKEIGYRGGAKGIPDLKDPDLIGYLEHIDDCYVEFMYMIKKVFPPVTLEVRVDHTPVYDATGTMHPYIHHKQMIEPDTDVLGTYFGTYMMIGPTPRTAEQAVEGMERAHMHTRQVAPFSKAFVDQFNFVMREKVFSQFEPLEASEIKRFLGMMVDWFDARTVGYATWSFVDYMTDIISNCSFRLGLEGWSVEGNARLVEVQEEGLPAPARQVMMAAGSSLSGSNIRHYSPWVKDGWIVIEAALDPEAVLTVDLGGDLRRQYQAADFTKDALGVLPRLIRPFEGQTRGFKLRVEAGGARIARASMGGDLCSNGGLTVGFGENEISQLVAAFNRQVQERSGDGR
ncbi:sulfotransferase family 2 domain-containing protein [Xinfangfangia sp. CPCC 101601]|uniref:Sulfotransferase family 2 domain-containing protein n=2 Tax=Pseudogemmobacter lacusdianii TaxID=3069608 RepID=A0ABU0W036_9RHOB|nr:sulfotransferase family 2 domain-containing protein [Xinfangfangia sp. CPCC 101601]